MATRATNGPRFEYRTGAIGLLETFVAMAYTIVLVFYYVGPFFFIDASAQSTVYRVFLVWSAFKPVVPVLVFLFAALYVISLPLTVALVVVIGLIAVGSVGMLGVILASYSRCNLASHPDALCNDLLYCCVYAGTVPSCAGLGPCALPAPQLPSDLSVNPDLTSMLIYTIIFLVLELTLMAFVFALRQVIFAKDRLAQELLEDANNRNAGIEPGFVDDVSVGSGDTAVEGVYGGTTPWSNGVPAVSTFDRPSPMMLPVSSSYAYTSAPKYQPPMPAASTTRSYAHASPSLGQTALGYWDTGMQWMVTHVDAIIPHHDEELSAHAKQS